MDAETMKIIADHATFLKKINTTYGMDKLNKYDLLTKRFFLLDEVLKCYTKGQKICCLEPRPKEKCDIFNLVQALIEALETTMDNVPQSYIEVITNKYLEFSNSLELMQMQSRNFRGRFIQCSITRDDMSRWRVICTSLHMLLLSRYGFCQEVRFIKTGSDMQMVEKKYHDLMWARLGKLGYTLPVVKYLGGIQEFEKKKLRFISEVIEKVEFRCSDCEKDVGRDDDCAILNSCDHLYCIKCAYTMAAKKDVRCKVCICCNETMVEWTTKSLILRSKAAYDIAEKEWSEAKETFSKIGILGIFTAFSIFIGIYRKYGSVV